MSEAEKQNVLSLLSARRGFWITAAGVIVVDQLTKLVAQLTLKPDGWQSGDPQPRYEFIDGLIHGTWAHGELSFAPAGPTGLRIASLIFAGAFWLAAFYGIALRSGPKRHVLRIAGGMLLGGILSNFVESLISGHVRNFMLMGFENPFWSPTADTGQLGSFYARNPSFSFAAVAIALGMILLIVGALVGKPKKAAPPPPPQPRPGKRPPPGQARPGGAVPPPPQRR